MTTQTTVHFGRPNSGLRTACGKLLRPSMLDTVLTRDPLSDAITCNQCLKTTDYRYARVQAQALQDRQAGA